MKTKLGKKALPMLLSLLLLIGLMPTVAFAAGAEETIPETKWSANAAANFEGGEGTAENPYLIKTAAQLAKLSNDVNGGERYAGKYFKLTADINLSAHLWTPIGTDANHSFGGFLEGNSQTISGMIVKEGTAVEHIGFFGDMDTIQDDNTVGVRNLTISGARIYAEQGGAGILAGYATANKGKKMAIENITVSGTIEVTSSGDASDIGGMIGYALRANVKNCKAEDIEIKGAAGNAGPNNCGGFVGISDTSVFENCEVSGSVSGTWTMGGFVGNSNGNNEAQAVYKKCAADVDVNASNWRAGGFAGNVYFGTFENCVTFGDVTSIVTGFQPKIGGFFGATGEYPGFPSTPCVIAKNCHAAGTLNSQHPTIESGGFVGNYTVSERDLFENCSFDTEKNSGLKSAGEGAIQSGVTGENGNKVLSNICMDYYGAHEVGDTTLWTTDVEPTCTTAGSESQHCARCGEKCNAKEIPATGHNMTHVEEKPATHMAAGNTEYWYCDKCEEYFSDEAGTTAITLEETVIPALTEHTADASGWHSDDKNHWNTCECGEKLNVTAHSFEWVVDKAATATEKGLKHEECTVCGYKKAAVEIPATGTTTPSEPSKPTKPNTGNPNEGTGSPQTGDSSNVALWIAIMLMSGTVLTGTALYNRKKKYSR